MRKIVTTKEGTASLANVFGYEIGGKTGTAQVRRITMEERERGLDVKTLPWKFRHHALFVGYAPVKNPRYVVSVVVEHGVSGSGTAAPLARDVMKQVLKINPAGIA